MNGAYFLIIKAPHGETQRHNLNGPKRTSTKPCLHRWGFSLFCYNVQQIASHKPGAMLWQVLPPVKALGHRNGAEQGKEYHKRRASKGRAQQSAGDVAERRALPIVQRRSGGVQQSAYRGAYRTPQRPPQRPAETSKAIPRRCGAADPGAIPQRSSFIELQNRIALIYSLFPMALHRSPHTLQVYRYNLTHKNKGFNAEPGEAGRGHAPPHPLPVPYTDTSQFQENGPAKCLMYDTSLLSSVRNRQLPYAKVCKVSIVLAKFCKVLLTLLCHLVKL